MSMDEDFARATMNGMKQQVLKSLLTGKEQDPGQGSLWYTPVPAQRRGSYSDIKDTKQA